MFPGHFFAARFSGYLTVATAGVYQFQLAADGASTLFFDDALVIGTGNCYGFKLKDVVLNLSRGELPPLVECFQRRPLAFMRLEWSGPFSGNTRGLVNESVVSRAVPGLCSELLVSRRSGDTTPPWATCVRFTRSKTGWLIMAITSTLPVEVSSLVWQVHRLDRCWSAGPTA